MVKEKKSDLSPHDEGVKRVCDMYIKEEAQVKCDIVGGNKPQLLGIFRPDIEVTKNGKKIFIEVETKDSEKADQKKNIEMEKAARKIGAKFKKIVIDDSG